MKAKDWVLPLFYFFLSTISLVMLWSLTPELLNKQLLAFIGGGLILLILSRLPLTLFFRHPLLWYGIIIIGLILPLIIPTSKTTQRWIDLPFFSIQPSQFAFTIVSLALITWLGKWGVNTMTAVTKYLLFIIIPAFLIAVEPNLGTTLLFISVMSSLFFLAGLPVKYLVIAALLGIIFLWSGWNWGLKDYQKTRITSFVSASENNSANYNSRQALIAIGNGGLWGLGLDQGYQSQLKFLPEKHTDFIFASLAEEFGLLGSLVILATYTFLIGFLIWAGQFTQPQYRLFILTSASLIFMQVTLHIGANVRLLPITGLPLPLLSYGGSSIISFALMFGICQKIILDIKPEKRLFIS